MCRNWLIRLSLHSYLKTQRPRCWCSDVARISIFWLRRRRRRRSSYDNSIALHDLLFSCSLIDGQFSELTFWSNNTRTGIRTQVVELKDLFGYHFLTPPIACPHCPIACEPSTIHSFIHSGYFYSPLSSLLLLLRGAPDYSIDIVSELTRRSPTGNFDWGTYSRSLLVILCYN